MGEYGVGEGVECAVGLCPVSGGGVRHARWYGGGAFRLVSSAEGPAPRESR